MRSSTTEQIDRRYDDLDLRSSPEVADAIIGGQREVLRRMSAARLPLGAAIDALAAVMSAGGRMAYAGAGSSGLLAHLDALELPGTFGIESDRVPVILAGGTDALSCIPAGTEDNAPAAEAAVDALHLGPGDALVAVAASGGTPFTLAALRRARDRGAVTVAIACVRESGLLSASHHPIFLDTVPEVVAGSTRMTAGTAQKCALNVLSTGVAVRLGHAYRGLMVGMRPENEKLRRRAVGIVSVATGLSEAKAADALAEADWSIKTAIVAAGAASGVDAARRRLELSRGDVRVALGGVTAA